MSLRELETPGTDEPTDELQKHLMAEYLCEAGHTWSSVRHLPEDEFKRIMTAAAQYACARIAELRGKPVPLL